MVLLIQNWALFFLVMVPICIILVVIVGYSIAAVWEISKNKSLDREKRRELTNMVTWWPIFGCVYYYVRVRKGLIKDNEK